MGREFYLHAGAHRTGTSSFQLALSRNRLKLLEAGYDLAYPSRDGAPRGRLKLKLPTPGARVHRLGILSEDAGVELSRHLSDAPRPFILSEENIPGRMFHFYEGKFFPAAELRIEVLRRALHANGIDRVSHLLMVVRPYAELFLSAHRKRAEDNLVTPFYEIAPAMAQIDRGWPALVSAFTHGLNIDRLTVVDYRARGSSSGMIRRLLEGCSVGVPGGLEEPEQSLNLSATDPALVDLQRRYREGEELSREEWQAVIAEHAHDAEDRGFGQFSERQSALLAERYAEDLETLARRPEVTLVR